MAAAAHVVGSPGGPTSGELPSPRKPPELPPLLELSLPGPLSAPPPPPLPLLLPQAPTMTEQPKASERSGRYTRIRKVCHRAASSVTYHGTIPVPTVARRLQPGVRLSVFAPV
jgi:hypothetical protein